MKSFRTGDIELKDPGSLGAAISIASEIQRMRQSSEAVEFRRAVQHGHVFVCGKCECGMACDEYAMRIGEDPVCSVSKQRLLDTNAGNAEAERLLAIWRGKQ